MSNDNLNFVLDGLKSLESNGKFREIKWLAESYFCGKKISGMLKDDNGNCRTVLIPMHCDMDKDTARKDSRGHDRYYTEPVKINGTEYLVYNHWTDNARQGFQNWLNDVLGE